jgi:hypothetical protein
MRMHTSCCTDDAEGTATHTTARPRAADATEVATGGAFVPDEREAAESAETPAVCVPLSLGSM